MSESRSLSRATLGALGVVYGDIGTSPLYALREATAAAGGVASAAAVLGVVSLIFWSLLLVISIKYVVLILRADNDGEGGILSLVALVQRRIGTAGPWASRLIALGVLGTALFYCDALITPAISVLSAVEGLELLSPRMHQAVLPVTIGILVALFALQRRGTERVGRLFGPIMIIWFGTLAVLGVRAILEAPGIFAALNPVHAIALLLAHPGLALAILGAVFLVLTGGEALYADMGHFGRTPVRLAWFTIVWPGAPAQLLRPGRAAARASGGRVQSVLPARAGGAAAGADRARDDRDRDRLAGDDLRRVLDHAPGRAARPAAAREDPADLRRRARADLRAGHQHHHVHRRGRLRARLRLLERAVGRLWRLGDGHDADHDAARRRGRGHRLAVAGVAHRAGVRPVPRGRSCLRRRQRQQDPATAAGCRSRSRPACS